MKSRTLMCITAMILFAALAMPVQLAAQQHHHYKLIDMGTFGGSLSAINMATDVNGQAVNYTGRILSDPLKTLETAGTILTGAGSQTGGTANGANRWGDYSSLVLDPANDCTFWYVNQYIPSNGNFNFHTRLASFKFPGCV